MAIQNINVGAAPNDKTGDSLRDAFIKANANFSELDTRTTTAQTTADAAAATANAALPAAEKGAANGVAPLDANQKVPSANLPSYVDDVLEFATLADFPNPGETGKIYVAANDGTPANPSRQYRWGGSVYVEISPSPGSTDAVPEGATNKYFTEPRVIAALANNADDARAALGVYGEGQTIPVYAASNIPQADVGPIYVMGVGTMEWVSTRYVTQTPSMGAYINGTQAIPHSTYTKIEFNAVSFDTHGWYDYSGAKRYTPKLPGLYAVELFITFFLNSGAVGDCDVIATVYKNGAEALWASSTLPAETGRLTAKVSGVIPMNGTTDYLEPWGYFSRPGDITVSVSSGSPSGPARNWFCIHRVAPLWGV